MCAVYVTEVAWQDGTRLWSPLEHQIGGSCDLGERPGKPGVQGQHCLSTEEFHQPGRRTIDSSEGSWRTPTQGGTRHCIDTLLSEQHMKGSSFHAIGTPLLSSFSRGDFSRKGPQLNSQIQAILLSLFCKLQLTVSICRITIRASSAS